MSDIVERLRFADDATYQLICEKAADEIERLRRTNHADLVYPPFGESFTLPDDALRWEWIRENCVMIRANTLAKMEDKIERLRKDLHDCHNWIRSEMGIEEA